MRAFSAFEAGPLTTAGTLHRRLQKQCSLNCVGLATKHHHVQLCFQHLPVLLLSGAQAVAQLQQVRGYAAKEIQFGTEGRASMLVGVERLANAVQVTLGPKVRSELPSMSQSLVTVGGDDGGGGGGCGAAGQPCAGHP